MLPVPTPIQVCAIPLFVDFVYGVVLHLLVFLFSTFSSLSCIPHTNVYGFVNRSKCLHIGHECEYRRVGVRLYKVFFKLFNMRYKV